MSAKHTPGPWLISKGDGRSEGYIREQRQTEFGRNVAVCKVTTAGRSWEEREANARLIAEAPAMVEALRIADAALVAAYTCMDADERDVAEVEQVNKALKLIRAILARIEGSQ